jgi:hypothetical protein
VDTQVLSLEVKMPEHGVDCSPIANPEVLNSNSNFIVKFH